MVDPSFVGCRSRRVLRSRRFVCGVALAACLPTPGCVTAGLWVTGDPILVTVADRSTHQAIELCMGGAGAAAGLWLRPAGAASAVSPNGWLRQVEGGEQALALLASSGASQLESVVVQAERTYVDGLLTAAFAELEIVCRLDPASLWQRVDAAAVSATTHAVLRAPRWNAFVSAREPLLHVPPVFADCIERLATFDLAQLAALPPGSVQVASWVFVGDDEVPRYLGPHAETHPESAAAATRAARDRPLGNTLAELASLDLLLRVQMPAGVEFWRLQPEVLWLWANTDARGGLQVHRSRWRLEPAAAMAGQAPGADALWTAAQFLLRELRKERRTDESSVAVKLLLTPFTLAADVVVTPAFVIAYAWLGMDDDEDEERHRGTGRR